MLEVTTRRLPPPSPPFARSHVALDSPCQLGTVAVTRAAPPAAVLAAAKWNRRVCVPASVSMRSVSLSCQVMCRRPGTLMMAPAPYDLHWFPARWSATGSQLLMIGRAAGDAGMRRYSPLAG